MTSLPRTNSGKQPEPQVKRTDLPQVVIYTDGSCEPNPGVAGWGCVLLHPETGARKEHCGHIGSATNNVAELTAAIEALKLLKKPCWVQLHSDSQWFINCASGTFKRHKYHDLWQQLDELAQPHLIEWLWIKGHDLNAENERAHQLANLGRMQRVS